MDKVLYEVAVVTSHTRRIQEKIPTDIAVLNAKNSSLFSTFGLAENEVEHYPFHAFSQKYDSGPHFIPDYNFYTHHQENTSQRQLYSNLKHSSVGSKHFFDTSFQYADRCSSVSEYLSAQEGNFYSNTFPQPPSGTETSEDFRHLSECSANDASAKITTSASTEFDPSVAHNTQDTTSSNNDDNASALQTFLGVLAEKICDMQSVPMESEDEIRSSDTRPVVSRESRDTVSSSMGSDVDSEDYFSTTSQQLEDTCDSNNLPDSNSRSSRTTSQSDDLESLSLGSDDNFADVESLDMASVSFSERRKKQFRMKKSRTPLETIFSPVIAPPSSPTAESPSSKEETSRENRERDLLSDNAPENSDSQSNSDSGATSSSGYHDNSSLPPGGVSDDGNTTETSSSLNPLCSPFIPRALKEKQAALFNESVFGTNIHDKNISQRNDSMMEVTYNDSGLVNTTNLMSDQNSLWYPQNQTMNESAFYSGYNTTYDNHQINTDAFGTFGQQMSQIKCGREEIQADPSPFECGVPHRDEFQPLHEFFVDNLPSACRSLANWNTIFSVSHRVVRLCVKKPYNTANENTAENLINRSSVLDRVPLSTDDEKETFQHYGTGFAYFIGPEFVEVRTHLKVVSTPEEAGNTRVTFSLDVANKGRYSEIDCYGLRGGFHSNKFSQTCTFKCKTPSHLLDHSPIFRDIPVYSRSSIFCDSSYFSEESSRESSSTNLEQLRSGHEPVETSSDEQNLSTKEDLVAASPEPANVVPLLEGMNNVKELGSNQNTLSENQAITVVHTHRPEPEDDGVFSDTDNFLHAPEWDVESTENSESRLMHDDEMDVITTTTGGNVEKMFSSDPFLFESSSFGLHLPHQYPLEDCDFDAKRVKAAFESVSSFEYKLPKHRMNAAMAGCSCPNNLVSELIQQVQEYPSPLKIMEKRRAEVNANGCPYRQRDPFQSIGEYKCFSSYAEDVLMQSIPEDLLQKGSNISPYAGLPGYGIWEYEGLLHAQAHDKDAFSRWYKNANTQKSAFTDVGTVNDTDVPEENKGFHNGTDGVDATQGCKSLPAKVPTSDDEYGSDEKISAVVEDHEDVASHLNSLDDEVFEDGSPSDGDKSGGRGVCKGVRGMLESAKHIPSVSCPERASDEWDRDLLNLDENLDTMPPFGYFEDFVDQLVADTKHNDNSRQCQCCSKSEKAETYAVIVSYPHGGRKVVSIGRFSSHRHGGGDLYDTPTCMGSCGAPVVTITKEGGVAYVTHLIHAGTSRVNDVPTGIGVAFFDDDHSSCQQMRNIREP